LKLSHLDFCTVTVKVGLVLFICFLQKVNNSEPHIKAIAFSHAHLVHKSFPTRK